MKSVVPALKNGSFRPKISNYHPWLGNPPPLPGISWGRGPHGGEAYLCTAEQKHESNLARFQLTSAY